MNPYLENELFRRFLVIYRQMNGEPEDEQEFRLEAFRKFRDLKE